MAAQAAATNHHTAKADARKKMNNPEMMVYTMYFIWYLGAAVIALALLAILTLGMHAMLNAWRGSLQEVRLNLWVYMAMRAYQRAGHQRPDEMPMVDEKGKLQRVANYLIDTARDAGFVVTIATEPMQPLRMGNYYMEADVRPARKPD